MAQIQKNKPSSKKDAAPVEKTSKSKDSTELKADIDALLDEIDGVLETNAEEFVNSYVQRGGQ